MSTSYLIDPSQRVVVVLASGVVTAQHYHHLVGILRRDPRFDASFALLFDARGVTDVQIAHSEMMGLAEQSVFEPRAPRAIVANEGLVFGMARMYELSFSDGAMRRVFARMEAAEEWLGVSYARSLTLPRVLVSNGSG